MRGLTVRQPWAWAIARGGKNIENRTVRWRYRGALAIHAAVNWSPPRSSTEALAAAWSRVHGRRVPMRPASKAFVYGAVIAVAELVDVHPQTAACDPEVCAPWGEASYTAADGGRRVAIVHLVLVDVQPVAPVPCVGFLGLWTVPDDVRAAVEAATGRP